MPDPFREPIDLEVATALDGADGEYAVELTDDWQLWGPSGGYLAAITLRAAGEIAQLARPVSFYCHFVRAPEFGPAEVSARMIRPGRRAESIAVELHQSGKLMVTALVRTAAHHHGFHHQIVHPPDVPGPGELEEFRWAGPRSVEYTYWNNFERRPVTRPFSDENDQPVQLEWIRSIPTASFDDAFLDAARPLMALDTFGYPAVAQGYKSESFVSPNLDTSAWFHDIGAHSEWLLIDHSSPIARDGIIAVDGRVWSENGTLVANGSAHLLQIDA